MYTCPCCGYKVFEEFPGSFDICPICYWEDDAVQLFFPMMSGGANKVSLIEAQVNYFQFGASTIQMVKNVREPKDTELKDPSWFPLYQKKVHLPNPQKDHRQVGNETDIKELCYWLKNV